MKGENLKIIRTILEHPKRRGLPFKIALDEAITEVQYQVSQDVLSMLANIAISGNITQAKRKVKEYEEKYRID